MAQPIHSTPAPSAAPLTVIHVPFHGDSLAALNDHGKVWVPVRGLTEALGLEFTAQFRRLKRQPWAVVAMMAMTASDGKNYRTVCLDLDSLPMWLATVDVKRVAPSAREKLVVYQKECAKVLREHFFGHQGARQARTVSEVENEELVLSDRRLATLLGPKLGLAESNVGNMIRSALGLTESEELDPNDITRRVLGTVNTEFRMAVACLTNYLNAPEGAPQVVSLREIESALLQVGLRLRGFMSISTVLRDAEAIALHYHRPGRKAAPVVAPRVPSRVVATG